jgi:hypothetical protein
MDPQTERWPHVDIVRDELRRLRTEMTVSEQKVRNAHFAELRQAMTGYDMVFQRIKRKKGIPSIRAHRRRVQIQRQTFVSNFTQVMLEKGAQIYDRLQDGGTIPD